MRRFSFAIALAAAFSAWGDTPGRFDYYVLSLSWSPQYCAGKAVAGEPQCKRPYGFVLHGLWPQNERGWPRDCGRGEYLSAELIANTLRFMPSKPLIIHEWRQHGVCSGLPAVEYFATAERAYRSIRIPARYREITQATSTSVAQIENDFLAENPQFSADMLSSQCSGRYFRELRICLKTSLQPRRCSQELRDRCGSTVLLRPSR